MDGVVPMLAGNLDAVRLHRAELRDSIRALEQALAAPAPGRVDAWAERVHVAAVELSADLRQHVSITEGPDGLHRAVVGAAPRLSGAVQRLARDHVELARLVEDLLACTGTRPLADNSVASARGLGTRLLGRLARHRQAGADLLYEAYEADLGGET